MSFRGVDCACDEPGVPLTSRFDAAYVDSLLARILPFEAWVIRQRDGGRSVDDVGEDCGLPAWRIREVEATAIRKMTAMVASLAAD